MQLVDGEEVKENSVLEFLWARPGRRPHHSAHMLPHRKTGKCSYWVSSRKGRCVLVNTEQLVR